MSLDKCIVLCAASLALCYKNLQDTQVLSLGWENPLEKERATPSSTLGWEIPMTGEPGGVVHWAAKVRHDLATKQ